MGRKLRKEISEWIDSLKTISFITAFYTLVIAIVGVFALFLSPFSDEKRRDFMRDNGFSSLEEWDDYYY
jgi:hypothetical protein